MQRQTDRRTDRAGFAVVVFAAVFVLLPGVTALGCVTAGPVVRLVPDGGNPVWRAGCAMVARDAGGFRVAVAFDQQHAGLLAFRVEVENRSGGRVDVDPSTFSYETCTATKVCARTRVVDPERMLVDMDIAREHERADQANEQAAATVLVMLDTVSAVGAAASGHPRQALASVAASEAVMTSAEVSNSAHDQNVTMIDWSQATWSQRALRHTTLIPMQGVGGLVLAPLDPGAATVWLGVAVASQRFWFPFQQVVYDAPETSAPPGRYDNR